jgi:TatD DNase family protein
MTSNPIVFTDTHAHLYAEPFDHDRNLMVERAVHAGVKYLFLPNIDSESIEPMHALTEQFPENCFAMMGLHPCHVKPDSHSAEMQKVQDYLFNSVSKYIGVGEIGLDLYWDKSTFSLQKEAFIQQLEWAKTLHLPVSVHCRDAFNETMECIEQVQNGTLKGVIHCFGGDTKDAQRVIQAGFLIGIGGVVTFKKSETLREAIKNISLEHIVLETDAPYLAPEPYRGKRNESSYIPIIAATIAKTKQCTIAEVAEQTTDNALRLFKVRTVNLHSIKE